jgi:hypothetical protein
VLACSRLVLLLKVAPAAATVALLSSKEGVVWPVAAVAAAAAAPLRTAAPVDPSAWPRWSKPVPLAAG